MKLPFFLLIFLTTLLVSTCDKNLPDNTVGKTSNLDIVFKLKYGDQDLIFGDAYQYVGRPIRFDSFAFFISNLKLSKDDDGIINKIEISELEYLDFNNEQTVTLSLNNIPVGNYQGITMKIGVPSEFNESIPSEFGRNHPLSNPAMYNENWKSYIFTKLVGAYDSEINDNWDVNFNYATGKNLLAPYSVTKSVPITEDSTTVLHFEIGIDKLFGTDASNLINIVENPTTLTDNTDDLMNLLMNNFVTKSLNCL